MSDIPDDVMKAAAEAYDRFETVSAKWRDTECARIDVEIIARAILAERERGAEDVHYANGTAELAMKHRDEAEKDLQSLLNAVHVVIEAQRRFEADCPNQAKEPDPITTAIRNLFRVACEVSPATDGF